MKILYSYWWTTEVAKHLDKKISDSIALLKKFRSTKRAIDDVQFTRFSTHYLLGGGVNRGTQIRRSAQIWSKIRDPSQKIR
jgi:hypothetical protein